jgi:hypothetical protein
MLLITSEVKASIWNYTANSGIFLGDVWRSLVLLVAVKQHRADDGVQETIGHLISAPVGQLAQNAGIFIVHLTPVVTVLLL